MQIGVNVQPRMVFDLEAAEFVYNGVIMAPLRPPYEAVRQRRQKKRDSRYPGAAARQATNHDWSDLILEWESVLRTHWLGTLLIKRF